jgi:adenylosuccinate synthase
VEEDVICAVVGGQYGSEGKGLIVGHIAHDYDHHVRVGAANAGHTVYTIDKRRLDGRGEGDPEKHVMQQIPCAAYANPEADLYVGPGALISPEIFARELDLLDRWRKAHDLPFKRVRVDPRAHVIHELQIEREQRTDLAARIGSTSTIAKEGIGVAAADRLLRDPDCLTVAEWYRDEVVIGDAIELVNVPLMLGANGSVLLEGTQGYGLSNTTGDFPYVTSRNTTAAGLCADAGVPCTDRVILVCRTFPIRVAGNSGPFHRGSEEITWESINVDPEKERTTVTKKVRRVATFSLDQVAEAAMVNGATEIALTFADYLSPRLYGVTELDELDTDADKDLLQLVDDIQTYTGLPVTFLGTGPHSVIEAGRFYL